MIKNENKRISKYNFVVYNDIYWNRCDECKLWSDIVNNVLHTKWGTAKLQSHGYYQISSYKEGYSNKRLHRLIFEDYYDCKLDENDVIHHIDGDKTNNHPSNLICMSKKAHNILHNLGENNPNYDKPKSNETKKKISESEKGKIVSEETMMKLSETHNNSGYFRVGKAKCKKCKQGFVWRYRYRENGKYNSIESVDIEKLEAKVRAKGLKWKKLKGDE